MKQKREWAYCRKSNNLHCENMMTLLKVIGIYHCPFRGNQRSIIRSAVIKWL